jgi:hypothetical protein
MPPVGIVIGAVDPVSGIACFDPQWDGFDVVTTWKGSISAKGVPDETAAKDFNTASAAALALQASLLDGVIHLSGLPRFAEFRDRLREVMTQYTTGSDFVHLPNAWFHRLTLAGPAPQPETVDLGIIGKYSQHPDAQYQGHRYTQTGDKTFRFNMAVRTDVSLIQLGYRMELGERSIELISYSIAPADGPPAPRFPTEPISVEINADDWMIYDVYQNRVFSDVDEDAFEGGVPPVGPRFATQTASVTSNGTSRLRQIGSISSVFPEERIFLNERKGPVALRVDITFDADLNSIDQPYVGQATVTIRNLNPDACPGGIILPVRIYEIRPDDSAASHSQEVPADWMTIHIVPSFLALPERYFQDRREGRKSMGSIFEHLNQSYAISARPVGPVDPEWQVRRHAQEEVAMDEAVQAFSRARPEVAQAVLQRYLGGVAQA